MKDWFISDIIILYTKNVVWNSSYQFEDNNLQINKLNNT